MLEIKYFHTNAYFERTMVVWNENMKGFILDPGYLEEDMRDRVFNFIDESGITPLAILLTHAHFDHIYGVKSTVERYNIPVYMHPADKSLKECPQLFAGDYNMPVPDTSWDTVDIEDGQTITLDTIKLKVIWTPGHSEGCVCYYCEDGMHLFSGDTLFAGTIGKTDHRYGNYDKIIVSLMDKIMSLDSDVKVHPGHGGGTTIGYERINNPFLQPFNEKDEQTGSVDGITFEQ